MRVRTDGGALVAGAVLAAVLTLVTVGDGSPPKKVVEPRATLSQMPRDDRLPTFHRVAPPAEGAATQAPDVEDAPPPAEPAANRTLGPPPNLDAHVLQALQGALTYVLLFLLAHLTLRRLGVGGRWPYAGAGAAAALLCIASQTPRAGWAVLLKNGELSLYLGIVLIAGAIMGFLYHWRAGLEATGDDPARLAQAVDQAGEGEVVVDTGEAEYFSGPLQVRTSLPIAFVASLLSSGLFGLAQTLFGMSSEIVTRLGDGTGMPAQQVLGLAVKSQLHSILIMGLIAPIPFTLLVLLGHMILRARDRMSYSAYLIMGAGAPLLLTLVMGPMGFLLGLQAAVPMAISMCVYRNMAGVEPKRVKEDIRVKDRRDLVGEDHARRRYGRLIKT